MKMIVNLFILYLGDLFFICSLIFIAINPVNSSKEAPRVPFEVFTNHILVKKDMNL